MKYFIASVFICLLNIHYASAQSFNPVGLKYDESNLAIINGTVIVADPTAEGGHALFRAASTGGETIWFGPYATLQAGNYLVQFRMKVLSAASTQPICSIDVASSSGGFIASSLSITPSQFRADNEWQLFTLPIQISANVGNIEVRGLYFQPGVTDIYLDYINILPGDLRGFFSNEFTITPKGNVGLGITYPTHKLDINGDLQLNGLLKLKAGELNIQSYETNNSFIANNTFYGPSGFTYSKNGYAGALYFLDGNFEVRNAPAGNAGNTLNWQVPLKITREGNVGIGTSAPYQKVDVAGSIRSYHASFGSFDGTTSAKGFANFATDNHGSVIMSSNLYKSDNPNLKTVNSHATLSGAAIIIPGNSQPHQNGILFYTKPVSAVTADDDYNIAPRMFISPSGNIGIGTVNPQSELAVNGVLTSKKVKVTAEGWADYVFDSTYQLAPLSQVERFIQVNKHLPDIPPAAQVKKDGLDIGENQALLLRKIEELTLYIISQNKELAEQHKKTEALIQEVKELKSRIKE